MPRSVIRLLNLALFGACCFQVAQIANGLVGSSLEAGAPSEAGTAAVGEQAAPAWQERLAIVERNLFGAQLEGAVPVVEIVEEDVEETRLPLSLVGTIAATGKSSRAAIYDTKTRASQVLRPGDTLEGHPQVTLDRVERGRVLLLNQGRREELLLAEASPVAATRPAARPPRAVRPARRPRREPQADRTPTAAQRIDAIRRAQESFSGDDDEARSDRIETLRERMLSGELDLDALGEEVEAMHEEGLLFDDDPDLSGVPEEEIDEAFIDE